MSVRHCCCGCSLKTGCIIIGVLFAVNGIVALLSVLHGVNIPELEVYFNNQLIRIIAGADAAIQLMMGVTLIIGADLEKPKLLHAWIVYYVIKLGLDAAWVVWILIDISSSDSLALVLTIAGVSAVGFGVGVYCLVVVNSYYKQLTGHEGKIPLDECV